MGQDREIFVAGYAVGGFPCVPYGGLYSANAAQGARDGVIMRFDQAHQYIWGTYFGGDASGNNEKINTIAIKEGERLYACGRTDSDYGQNGWFPLTDEQIPGSWFEDYHSGTFDGFVSAFCFGAVVGAPAVVVAHDPGFRAWQDRTGQWCVVGATTGMRSLFICDAAGRTVMRSRVRVPNEGLVRIDVATWLRDHIFCAYGEHSAKVLVPQH